MKGIFWNDERKDEKAKKAPKPKVIEKPQKEPKAK